MHKESSKEQRSLYLSDDTWNKLREIAKAENRTMSAQVKHWVDNHKREKENAKA